MVECPICYDEVAVSSTVRLCSKSHRLCVECSWACCKSALGDGLVPACPLERQAGCGAISKQTTCTALTRWLTEAPNKEDCQARKAELMDGSDSWVPKGSKGHGFSCNKIEDVSSARACTDRRGPVLRQGVQRLVRARSSAFGRTPAPRLHACSCGAVFCSSCRTPWHRRSTCAEALRLHARWCRFLQDELVVFLMAAVRADGSRWASVLEAYSKRRGALDQAASEALCRFDELRKSTRTTPHIGTLGPSRVAFPCVPTAHSAALPFDSCASKWSFGRRSTASGALLVKP